MSFPWYAIVFLMLLIGWPYLLAAAAVLGLFGLMAQDRGRLWLLVPAWGLLVLGTLSGLVFVDHKIGDANDVAKSNRREAELQETLTAPRQVLDSTLPAGTMVQWTDEARVAFRSVELARPTRVFGLVLTGGLEHNGQANLWTGELAEDQAVSGWPCRKGDMEFSDERKLAKCVLTADRAAYGVVIPAGSNLRFNPGYDTHDFVLPADRSMLLRSLGLMLPPLTEVNVMQDHINGLSLPAGTIAQVHGLPLDSSLMLKAAEDAPDGGAPTELSGYLATDFACAGHTYPKRSTVTLVLGSWHADIVETQEAAPDLAAVDVTRCVSK